MAARPHEAVNGGGLQALNDANDAARLDKLLHQYFRLGMPATAVSSRRRKRPHDASASTGFMNPNDEVVTPDSALKQLKAFLKQSTDDRHILRVFDAVQSQLSKAKKHKTLVSLVVRLCSELFTRSALFRSTIASQAAAFYQQLLEGAGEKDFATKRRRVSSSSASVDGKSTSQSAEVDQVLGMIETWRDDYGAKYPTIVAGYAGLEDKGYVFPRLKERVKQTQQREAIERSQQESLRRVRLQKMQSEMARGVPEIETTLSEMDSVFEILVPTLDAFELELERAEAVVEENAKATEQAPKREKGTEEREEEAEDSVEWESVDALRNAAEADGEDEVEWEDVVDAAQDQEQEHYEEEEEEEDPVDTMDINDIVQAYGLGSSSYQLTISIPTTLCEKSSENEVLFRTLTDGVLQIRKRFLPLVRDWLQVADADTTTLTEPRGAALVRQLCDLQARLEAATLKWEDLVKESERKKFARVQPRVVSLPLTAFSSSAQQVTNRKPAKRQRSSAGRTRAL